MLHVEPILVILYRNAYNVFYFPVIQDYRKRHYVGSEVIDNPQGIAKYR